MIQQLKEMLRGLWTNGYGPYVLLPMSCFTIFIVPMLVQEKITHGIIVEILFLIILVSGVLLVPTSNLLKISTVSFVVFAACSKTLNLLYPSNLPINIIDNVLAIITLLVFVILMTRQFFKNKFSLICRISAAVTIYLLLGLLWAKSYEIVYLIDPSAFSNVDKHPFTFIYFSFVTLVTLGYGDIVPVNLFARNLAILEGVIGQLYLVIFISALASQSSQLLI